MSREHPIRALRKAQMLTQEALAAKARVSIRTVNSIECFQAHPRYETQRKLLKALDVDFSRHAEVFPEAVANWAA